MLKSLGLLQYIVAILSYKHKRLATVADRTHGSPLAGEPLAQHDES